MRPPVIVAVSQRIDVIAGRAERRDALDQRLVAFLLQAGAVPVPVPNALVRETGAGIVDGGAFDAWISRVRPGAVVLSGGNDIGQCPDRDLTEQALLDLAERQALPVLGICRGMQMMGQWAGGRLARVDGHVRSRHALQRASHPDDWPTDVNSYHDWSVVECPAGFSVAACSEDGGIEAICHASLPWEGWMWHPEREPTFSPADLGRTRKLLQGWKNG